jgi:nicotinamidase/pyrazinamidase
MRSDFVDSPDRNAHSLGHRLELRPGDALIVVDMQRDFLEGGALPTAHSKSLVSAVNRYIDAFAEQGLPIFFSRDWHPPHHVSFQESGGPWPPHCVQGSPGAQWAEGMKVPEVPERAYVISKATSVDADAYSAFDGTQLLSLLENQRIGRVFVVGVATDYCVRATVFDARTHGFAVVLLTDAIRGVDLKPGDEADAIREMIERGTSLFSSVAISTPPDA